APMVPARGIATHEERVTGWRAGVGNVGLGGGSEREDRGVTGERQDSLSTDCPPPTHDPRKPPETGPFNCNALPDSGGGVLRLNALTIRRFSGTAFYAPESSASASSATSAPGAGLSPARGWGVAYQRAVG